MFLKRILKTLLDIEKDRNKTMKQTVINELLTLSEASKIWGKEVSTLRRNFMTNVSFKLGVDCRKSGSTWLVTKASMERVYGVPKNE